MRLSRWLGNIPSFRSIGKLGTFSCSFFLLRLNCLANFSLLFSPSPTCNEVTLNDIMDLGDNHSDFYQLNELLGVEIRVLPLHSARLFKRPPSTQARLYTVSCGEKEVLDWRLKGNLRGSKTKVLSVTGSRVGPGEGRTENIFFFKCSNPSPSESLG